ncbi:ribokinase [Sporosarcina sp. G11-34]|uniref:ribokinase n=1 Tax=Sporosarcina sp. G11-34 TaxID=2849605 RepID=UPI0022A9AC40|nr:ribokinase [Sporosarcina sp. G11-34]MCZ2260664.1 ribokinase [Sporosarcina sp. G11-34]
MITIVGSVNMDLVVQTADFPKQGETTMGELFTTVPGGKGANQAVAAARLGGDVHIVANVGDDLFGKELVENLRANSVNSEGVSVSEGAASGIANILLSDGDNRIIVVPGANYQLTATEIDLMTKKIEKSDLVVLQLEIPIPTIKHTLELCAELDVPVLMNPAPAGGFQKEFLQYVKYLTPNETECEQIFGTDMETALENHPNQLIVTLGSAGARFYDGEKHVIVEGFKTEVVDTTGAGDTFNGALAYALVEGFGLGEAVKFGNAAGSLAVEEFGAQGGMPSREDVERRLGGER